MCRCADTSVDHGAGFDIPSPRRELGKSGGARKGTGSFFLSDLAYAVRRRCGDCLDDWAGSSQIYGFFWGISLEEKDAD
jgi:hypothetical protein